MRIRTIKPEFWSHPVLTRLSPPTRLLALALLNYADDEGFFYADPSLVRGAVMPREDDEAVESSLQDLTGAEWIEIRRHPDFGSIGRVVNFKKHQCINKPRPSGLSAKFFRCEPPGGKTPDDAAETPENGAEACPPLADDGAEPPAQAPATTGNPSVLELPCNGKTKVWVLSRTKLAEYEALYPHLDAEFECRKARQWLVDNPARRKTAKGMTRFLGRWLDRANDSGRGGGPARGREPPRPSIAGDGDFSF